MFPTRHVSSQYIYIGTSFTCDECCVILVASLCVIIRKTGVDIISSSTVYPAITLIDIVTVALCAFLFHCFCFLNALIFESIAIKVELIDSLSCDAYWAKSVIILVILWASVLSSLSGWWSWYWYTLKSCSVLKPACFDVVYIRYMSQCVPVKKVSNLS